MISSLKDEFRKISIMFRSYATYLIIIASVTCCLVCSGIRIGYMVCMISAFFVSLTFTTSLKEEASFYIPMSIKDRNKRVLSIGAIIASAYLALLVATKILYSTVPALIDVRNKSGIKSVFTREDILLTIYMVIVIMEVVLSLKSTFGFSEDKYILGIKIPRFIGHIFIFTAIFIFAFESTSYAIDKNIKINIVMIVVGMVVGMIDILFEASQIKKDDCKWFAGDETK